MDSLAYLIVPATLGLLYTVGLVIYRLVFHPLARVPGPKLAAATQWYEGWYDLFVGTGGTYWKEIDRMHEKYGKTPRTEISSHDELTNPQVQLCESTPMRSTLKTPNTTRFCTATLQM